MVGKLHQDAENFVPPPAYVNVIAQLNEHNSPARKSANDPELGGIEYDPSEYGTNNNEYGTSNISIWELGVLLLIISKTLRCIGNEELPHNLNFTLKGITWVFFAFHIVHSCSTKKNKLSLPGCGAQLIRLLGLLIFFSNHVYGYAVKDDIFFCHGLKTNTSWEIFSSVVGFLVDVLVTFWIVNMIFKCCASLRGSKKTHGSENLVVIN